MSLSDDAATHELALSRVSRYRLLKNRQEKRHAEPMLIRIKADHPYTLTELEASKELGLACLIDLRKDV